jgi:hypothetical protein
MAKTTKDSMQFKDTARRTTRYVGSIRTVDGQRVRRELYAALFDDPDAGDPCPAIACVSCQATAQCLWAGGAQ